MLPDLMKLFNLSTILASTTGGDIKFTGLLNNMIKVDGTDEDKVIVRGTSTNYIKPRPLQEYIFSKNSKF